MTNHELLTAHEPPVFVNNVLPYLKQWRDQGYRTALVTLIARDGSSPRSIGAQMAVSEHGESVGHIAADCFGAALVNEARSVINHGRNQVVRFGKGSKYLDIRLPCGSGLDIYFDQALEDEVLQTALDLQDARRPFSLITNLQSGSTTIAKHELQPHVSTAQGQFERPYLPPLRLLIAGTGPTVYYLASLARSLDVDVEIFTPDKVLQVKLHRSGFLPTNLASPRDEIDSDCDPFTAVILAFHDHDWEPLLLPQLLSHNPFYVGAIGSRKAHARRLAELEALGVPKKTRSRIRGPVGLIASSRSPTEIALSVLAEIVAKARERGMLC